MPSAVAEAVEAAEDAEAVEDAEDAAGAEVAVAVSRRGLAASAKLSNFSQTLAPHRAGLFLCAAPGFVTQFSGCHAARAPALIIP